MSLGRTLNSGVNVRPEGIWKLADPEVHVSSRHDSKVDAGARTSLKAVRRASRLNASNRIIIVSFPRNAPRAALSAAAKGVSESLCNLTKRVTKRSHSWKHNQQRKIEYL